MTDDTKNRGINAADHHHNQPYYGTFQGVANYYPPQNPPPQPVVGFPQPIPPPPPASYDAPRYYYQGYHALPELGFEGEPRRNTKVVVRVLIPETTPSLARGEHIFCTIKFYAVADGRPLREHRLPCCGLGLGWLLFITGFFLGGLPWYIGTFILLCIQMDYREKPGLIACTVASFIALIAVTLGVTQRDHDWLSLS